MRRRRRFWLPNCGRPGSDQNPAGLEICEIWKNLKLSWNFINFVNAPKAEILAAELLPSRKRPNFSWSRDLWNLKKLQIKLKFYKFRKRAEGGDSGCRIVAVPEATKFQLVSRSVKFEKKLNEKKRNEKSTSRRARCQIDCVPEPAKFHLPLRFSIISFHVLVAQVPSGSIHTSVACGPHCPRPKDCPGLGYPNTLKWM